MDPTLPVLEHQFESFIRSVQRSHSPAIAQSSDRPSRSRRARVEASRRESDLPSVPLSVLDTSPIVAGSTAAEALHRTLDLARLVDDLGYHRYWVPEHHGMRGVACAATAVVVGRIAAATTRIRVGSGGVLLPNHAPLVVAEQFGTLEIFHLGRIDLGVGRALGGRRPVVDLVRGEQSRTAFPFREQLAQLLDHFRSGPAVPAVGHRPEVWLLGSSRTSAELAGALGLPYAFAAHLNPAGAAEAVGTYRTAFVGAAPRVLLGVPVIAADTDARAEWLAASIALKVLDRARGERRLLPTAEEANAYPYTAEDRAVIRERLAGHVVGSAATVQDALQRLVDDTGADELMITTPVHDHIARRRSYEICGTLPSHTTEAVSQ
ncbi:LLM class flavin-dependent oxidoreductase [Pseudonocardia sp. RS11V-5]|uniref:LLM class flavin-dependent oxidoreductase n=1 Tax=Pseudonocardia terrae TaxID=2905831 RepID=UPI001E5EF40D|nr:LLM class flavin-dependent oxidoreductase [Pseudonocardia terrae]MCE3552237.1 LLM class flavin-dependent oxidoreductase [Pseudonocardia terrae]